MKKTKKDYSLIATADGIQPHSWIRTPVSLSSLKGEPKEEGVAVWDTGAQNSGISRRMVKLLRLKNPKAVTETYADGKARKTKAYWVLVTFPNGRQAHVQAVAHKADNPDFIIGMDLICFGRFLLEPMGDGGVRFTFSI